MIDFDVLMKQLDVGIDRRQVRVKVCHILTKLRGGSPRNRVRRVHEMLEPHDSSVSPLYRVIVGLRCDAQVTSLVQCICDTVVQLDVILSLTSFLSDKFRYKICNILCGQLLVVVKKMSHDPVHIRYHHDGCPGGVPSRLNFTVDHVLVKPA
jgi:hypothetical protein